MDEQERTRIDGKKSLYRGYGWQDFVKELTSGKGRWLYSVLAMASLVLLLLLAGGVVEREAYFPIHIKGFALLSVVLVSAILWTALALANWSTWGRRRGARTSYRRKQEFLKRLKAEMFIEEKYAARDALVVLVREGEEPSEEVRQVLQAAGPQRWFPTEGGHLVKCPVIEGEFDKEIFSVEEGGWDHEHCIKCSGDIHAGDTCWLAEKDRGVLICDECCKKL